MPLYKVASSAEGGYVRLATLDFISDWANHSGEVC